MDIRPTTLTTALIAFAAAALPSMAADAADLPIIRAMPETKAPPPTKVAVLFAFKVHLPEGRGLAKALLDLGVDQTDAAAAAKVAAGHLGDGHGGCDAKIEISRVMSASGYRLERVSLVTQASKSTIERRSGELTLTGDRASRATARIA
jgi:hypothetical protein